MILENYKTSQGKGLQDSNPHTHEHTLTATNILYHFLKALTEYFQPTKFQVYNIKKYLSRIEQF